MSYNTTNQILPTWFAQPEYWPRLAHFAGRVWKSKDLYNPEGPIPGRFIYQKMLCNCCSRSPDRATTGLQQKMTTKRQLFSKKRQAIQYENPPRPAPTHWHKDRKNLKMSLLLDKTGHSLWPPDKSPRFLAILFFMVWGVLDCAIINFGKPYGCFT
jgi:hypothetical protein